MSTRKIKHFQTNLRFLGHNIGNGYIGLIDRAIELAVKFSVIDTKPLYVRLKRNPPCNTLGESHIKKVQERCILALNKVCTVVFLGSPYTPKCVLLIKVSPLINPATHLYFVDVGFTRGVTNITFKDSSSSLRFARTTLKQHEESPIL